MMHRLLLFVLLGLAPPASARLGRQSWGVDDGLPSASVSDLLQGPDGYLWLTTLDGLVRFDGARFTLIEPATSWPSRRMVSLQADAEGWLWITTESGHVLRFFPATRALQVFPLQPGQGVVYLRWGPTGALWAGTRAGVQRWNGSEFVPELLLPDVLDVVEQRDGTLWVTSPTALLRRSPDGQQAQWSAEALGVGALRAGQADGARVWVGGQNGLVYIEQNEVHRDLPGDWREGIAWLSTDAQGLWIGATNGLFRLEGTTLSGPLGSDVGRPPRAVQATGPDGRSWVATRHTVSVDGAVVWELDTRKNFSIQDILVDPEGSVWIAGAGLHRLSDARIQALTMEDGLASDNVYALFEDQDGTLFVGAQRGGLTRLGAEGVEHFDVRDGFAESVHAITRDAGGTLWAGTWTRGLWRWEDGRFMPAAPPHEPQPDPTSTVRALLVRRDGALWAGTDRGLWALQAGRWQQMDVILGLPPAEIRTMLEAPDGSLWAGTAGQGLLHIHESSGGTPRVTQWGASSALGSDLIRALWLGPAGELWVGTEDRGLQLVVDGAPTGRGLLAELPDHAVHALLPDGLGFLWGSTNRGLFRVRIDALNGLARGAPTPVVVDLYTERDGLENREGNGGTNHSALVRADGRLAFASQGGVILVDPVSVERGSPPAPLIVEEVEVDGESLPVTEDTLQLAPGQRSFGVRYTALSFRAPERIRFWYQLQDLEPSWVDAGNRRTAWYTAVPPGTYTFRVRSTNSDGQPSPHQDQLTIIVPPYFYETLWFRISAALALVGGFGAVVGLRLTALRRRHAELERLVAARTADLVAEKAEVEASHALIAAQARQLQEIDRLKTRSFTNLSHELRTPLTLILGPLEDIRQGRHGKVPAEVTEQVSRAERSARHLFGLVNQLLDVVKIDAGQLRLQKEVYDLGAVVAQVVEALQPLAQRRAQRISWQLPPTPVPVALDPRELPKVIWNLLGNAIKYTPRGGQIVLTVRVQEGQAQVEVIDNGPGISPEDQARVFERFFMAADRSTDVQPGTGLGLALARELTELHGGRLSLDSAPGQGSRFVVQLPLAAGPVQPWTEDVPPEVPAPDAPAPAVTDEERTAVLVVEDHAPLRAWIVGMLARRYRVIEAEDGLAALSRIRQDEPDLVITDVMMPVMDGHELVRAIRADPVMDWLPVIILTARGSTASQLEGLSRGADVYLTKPFSSEILLAQVEQLLKQRALLRTRFAEAPAQPLPSGTDATSADERYVQRIYTAVEEAHTNPDFDVQALADRVAQDRAHLYRRLMELTQEAPSDLIRRVRLEHAARLLARRAGSVSEIAYGVGFQSLSHFSTAFRKHFGVAPSQWVQKS